MSHDKALEKPLLRFRRFFAYTEPVFNLPDARFSDYTIWCKGCRENVPGPVEIMPSSWIIAECSAASAAPAYPPTSSGAGSHFS